MVKFRIIREARLWVPLSRGSGDDIALAVSQRLHSALHDSYGWCRLSADDVLPHIDKGIAEEVEPLGIRVMVVEPSGFRTDWAGRSAYESKRQIDAYAATAGRTRRAVRASSGNQPGDPVRAASAIIAAVESATPPHHLLLGNDAYDGALAKLAELRSEFTAWEQVARGADFPKQQRA